MVFYGKHGTDYAFPRKNELVIGGSFLFGDASKAIRRKTCVEKVHSYRHGLLGLDLRY